jgi:ribosomal-protein-alanine N-acetyltransferase
MEIRQLSLKDLSELSEFANSIQVGPHFSWDRSRLVQGLGTWEIWAGLDNQKIIVALAALPAGDQLELLWIQTRPEFRKQGRARKLMLQWLDSAKHKFMNVFLEVHSENLSAQNLYRSLGFSLLHTRKKYYSDGADASVFSLNLSN